jgi:hypothetical protein
MNSIVSKHRESERARRTMAGGYSGLLFVALSATGCAAEDPGESDRTPRGEQEASASGEPSSPRTEARDVVDGEDIAVSEQALTACGGVVVHDHGGDAFSATYEVVMGCACGVGYVRSFHRAWNTGHGSCSPIDWASPDPRDCRVRMTINRSGGFANGHCNLQVEKTEAARSCQGSCGGRAASGCWCDAACVRMGDCCVDKTAVCR